MAYPTPHIPDYGVRIAEQVLAAQDAGLPDVFFNDQVNGQPGPALAVIPPGVSGIGSARKDDTPEQFVQIRAPFALARHAVSTEEFETYARATGWRPRAELVWARGRQPVINIRHAEACAYAEWLSGQTGARYRLPSEAEWEYACRAGAETAFHFGTRINPELVHYNATQAFDDERPKKASLLSRCMFNCKAVAVGSLPANLWGLHEMHGNVWEFTATPWPFQQGRALVTKGGSWFDPAEDCRAAARRRRLADELDINLGFRLLRELG
jgi:formylglycine-generating enzyme required for sulfatase activity